MVTCVWTFEDGLTCGVEAAFDQYDPLPMCRLHHVARTDLGRLRVRKLAEKIPVWTYPGCCYVIGDRSGAGGHWAKIGYSISPYHLDKRLQAHRRALGRWTTQLILPGGAVTEALLHNEFRADRRVSVSEEIFEYSDAIHEFVTHPDPLERFTPRFSANVLQAMERFDLQHPRYVQGLG